MSIAKNHNYTERSSNIPAHDLNENSASPPDQQIQNKTNPPVLNSVVREKPTANETSPDPMLALPINASGPLTLINRSDSNTRLPTKPVAENLSAEENNQAIGLLTNPLTPFPQFLVAMQSAMLNPNIQIASKHLLLHAASSQIDSDKKIAYLLHMDADPNAIDQKGNSILMNATILGLTELGLSLIAHGADCKRTDHQHRNTLHYAAIMGNPELFRAQVEKNPTLLTIKDKLKCSALDYLLAAPKDRRATTLHLSKTNNINAARNEIANHDFINDKNGIPLEINKQRFISNKEGGQKLMALIKNDDENIACVQAQITTYTGRSLTDACIRKQANIRGTYLEQNNENSTCKLLNELLFMNKITELEFQPKMKLYILGFIDAVAELPSGQESVILNRLKEILPANLLTRHYESASLKKQFFAIEHIHMEGSQQSLTLTYKSTLENATENGQLPLGYNDLLPELKEIIFSKMHAFSAQDVSSVRGVNKAFYASTKNVMESAIDIFLTQPQKVSKSAQMKLYFDLLKTNLPSQNSRIIIFKNLCNIVNTYSNDNFTDA